MCSYTNLQAPSLALSLWGQYTSQQILLVDSLITSKHNNNWSYTLYIQKEPTISQDFDAVFYTSASTPLNSFRKIAQLIEVALWLAVWFNDKLSDWLLFWQLPQDCAVSACLATACSACSGILQLRIGPLFFHILSFHRLQYYPHAFPATVIRKTCIIQADQEKKV